MKNILFKRFVLLFILLSIMNVCVIASMPESSRIKPKSNRNKGILIRPEYSFGVYLGQKGDEHGMFSQAAVSVAYQFNPYFALGGGTGVNLAIFNLRYRPYWYSQTMHFEDNGTVLGNTTYHGVFPIYSLPLFLNARVHFCDRKWSPFVDFKVGYNLALTDKKLYEVYYDNKLVYKRTFTTNSISAALTFGVQYKIFSFGVTTSYFNTLNDIWETCCENSFEHNYNGELISLTTYHEGDESRYNYGNLSLLLYFSWDIPVGKK